MSIFDDFIKNFTEVKEEEKDECVILNFMNRRQNFILDCKLNELTAMDMKNHGLNEVDIRMLLEEKTMVYNEDTELYTWNK